jgi:hypothetical protein
MESVFSTLILLGLVLGIACFLTGAYFLYLRVRGVATIGELPRIGGIGTLQVGVSLMSAGGYFLTNATLSYLQFERSLALESKVNALMVKEASVLRKEYLDVTRGLSAPISLEKFARVNFFIDFLREIDPTNGHASYFAGEVLRMQGAIEKSHDYFYLHLEAREKESSGEREGNTGSEICYERPRGFCLQRSGWIHHLLANDFYQAGLTLSNRTRRLDRFELAIAQAKLAVRDFPQKGFEQGCPTTVLLKWLPDQIQSLIDNPAEDVPTPTTPPCPLASGRPR